MDPTAKNPLKNICPGEKLNNGKKPAIPFYLVETAIGANSQTKDVYRRRE